VTRRLAVYLPDPIYEQLVNSVPRPKISVYFDREILDKLSAWAENETRTVSNLVEHLTIQALKEKEAEEHKS
jgi:molybdopterin-guanine dinucleotide biosynthesis protein A